MSSDYDGTENEEYFNDHDDDGYCTMDYVRDVKKKLQHSSNTSGGGVKATQGNNDRVNDKLVIKKLIELEYDVDAVVSFFKHKQKQQQSQKQQVAQPTTTSKSSGTTSGATQLKKKESRMKHSALDTATEHVVASIVASSIPTTVFNSTTAITNENCKEVSHLQSKTQAALSDDEDVVNAMKMSIDHVKIPDGKPHQEQLDGTDTGAGAGEKVPHLTMVVTGHVDAGKSTLVGHLLFKCGQVSQKTIHKYEKESRAIGILPSYLSSEPQHC